MLRSLVSNVMRSGGNTRGRSGGLGSTGTPTGGGGGGGLMSMASRFLRRR